jgi:hypothetical protein
MLRLWLRLRLLQLLRLLLLDRLVRQVPEKHLRKMM